MEIFIDFIHGRFRAFFKLVITLLATGAISMAALGQGVSPQASSTTATNKEIATYKKMSLDELINQEVTSVSKEPERYAQAPAAVNVITGEQIRRSGASSFPEALRLADNLDVAQLTSSSWKISARGFNASVGNKLLVLMDGRSIYSPLFSGVIWNMQDYLLEDIDRIEVISGPGGTLWGANAVNGVINITSKNAKDTQGLYVEAGGGTWLQDFAGARYGGMMGSNVFYRVYAKYFDRQGLVYPDGNAAHDAWDRGQGGFRIDAEPTGQNQFTLQGDFFAGYNDTVPGGQNTSRAEGISGGGNLLGRWTHTFTDDADVSLQMYYDKTHLAAPFQSAGSIPAGTLYDDLDTYDLDFQNRFTLGTWNRVVWGFGYRFTHDVVRNAPLVAFIPNKLDQDLFNAFVQDEIKLGENVFFTLGTKVEHNDYTGVEFEPSGRLQWNVTDKQMIWGAISRAVRAPSRYDRELFEPDPAFGVLLGSTNSTFHSESVIAYEIGYRAHFGEKFSGSLSLYANDYDSLRTINLIDGANLPLVFQNNLQGHTYGLELSTDYQVLDWWRLHGGYNFISEHLHVAPGQTDLTGGINETADPQHQIFFRSSMDLPGHVELDLAVRWIDIVHNNDFSTPGTVPGYAEADARIAWEATKNLELSIVGQNLLHDHHPESGFHNSQQEEVTRNIYGKVTWRF